MELVNRKTLMLTPQIYKYEDGSVDKFKRIVGNKQCVYVLNVILEKYQKVFISDFPSEVQEFIATLEKWDGTIKEALEAGMVEGYPAGEYHWLEEEEVRKLNPSIWYLPGGWYHESEVVKLKLPLLKKIETRC